jgi:serine/threonine-protein kinase HipA
MKKIDVGFRGWGESWTLGTLADIGQGPVFEYSAGVQFSPLRVPLGTQSWGGLPGFIDDALPDGWGMLLMDRVFRKHGLRPETLSPLDRLSFIGERAMGALSFRPAASLELGDRDYTLLELGRAAEAIANDGDLDTLKTLAIVGGSPHGARPKALVQFDAATLRVSTHPEAPGEPWLVKFPARGEHKEVCGIEFAYARLAHECGIDMPDAHLFDLGRDFAAFGVKRFDREAGMRVPVHSAAGALHADFRLPSLDYQTLLRVTRFFTRDEQEVRKAFGRCVFNVVFHNRDDHAKNFAFRMDRRFEWKLSPAYDLSFSKGPGGGHQTSIMGEAKAPGRADLEKLAADSGLPKKFASECIGRTCDAASRLAPLLAEHGVRQTTRKAIVSTVSQCVRGCL